VQFLIERHLLDKGIRPSHCCHILSTFGSGLGYANNRAISDKSASLQNQNE
jgi:hypothetical protein